MDIVFDSLDGSCKIKIVSNVVELLNSYRQIRLFNKEAGGLLICRESIESGNIIVEFATEPYNGDVRKRYRFYRRDIKHIEEFNRLYSQHRGIYGYFGEWHTHPEKYPCYSWIDKDNWEKIATHDDNIEKIYYHVIVGTESICVWAYNSKKKVLKKVY